MRACYRLEKSDQGGVHAGLCDRRRRLGRLCHVDIVWELNGPHSFDKYKKLHWRLWAGLEYVMFNKGPVTSNLAEGGAFWWGDRGEPTPDLQFHFLPGAGLEKGIGGVLSGNGCTLNCYQVRPRSRGSVTLASSDPAVAPRIDPNGFAEPL